MEGGLLSFRERDGTPIPGASLRLVDVSRGKDLFVIEAYSDSEGSQLLFCYGLGWKGTYAAGKYYFKEIHGDPASYPYVWMVSSGRTRTATASSTPRGTGTATRSSRRDPDADPLRPSRALGPSGTIYPTRRVARAGVMLEGGVSIVLMFKEESMNVSGGSLSCLMPPLSCGSEERDRP
jgi:hypothetical protein